MFLRLPACIVTLMTAEGAGQTCSRSPVSHLPGPAATRHPLQSAPLAHALAELQFLHGAFQGIPKETCAYDSDLGCDRLQFTRFQASFKIARGLAAQIDFSFLFWFVRHWYSGPSCQSCWCISEINVVRNHLFSLGTVIHLFSPQCIKGLGKYMTDL